MEKKSSVASVVGALHQKLVFGRRVRILADRLATRIPASARVLDVGCGDGTIDVLIASQRPDVSIEGTDVLVRPKTQIPVRQFNGAKLPYPDSDFQVVMFVDVLHHARDPLALLREAARVGKMILIKDHFCEGFLAGPTLRLMDWVGNAPHGVPLLYNYWSKLQWSEAFREIGLIPSEVAESPRLYPPPASWLFDRGLHFVACLERRH